MGNATPDLMTKEEMEARIRILADEMDANDEDSMPPDPSRLIISMCCWVIASPAVFMTFTIGLVIKPRYVIFPMMVVAWVALVIMNLGWLRRKKVHWFWPVAGTICGLPSSLYGFLGWPPIYFSVVPLAFYLAYFHLKKTAQSPQVRRASA